MSYDREKEGVQRKTLAEMPMKKAKEEVTRKERGWEGSKSVGALLFKLFKLCKPYLK